MSAKKKKQCGNCRWFERMKTLKVPSCIEGECHRFPPTTPLSKTYKAGQMDGGPIVHSYWWCGEWKRIKGAKLFLCLAAPSLALAEPMVGQVQNVSPGFLKESMLLAIGLIGGAAGLASIYGVVAKRKREITPQPLEVRGVSEPVTKVMCDEHHLEISRRLEAQDKQIEDLWNVVRDEHTKIRGEMTKGFLDTERALGRIEGLLNKFMGT